MAFQDKTLTCRDCGKDFVWSAGEQEFYASKGFQNPPVRCPECRKKRKEQRGPREMTKIICKECGKEGEVPFRPKDPASVLCAECFAKQRQVE